MNREVMEAHLLAAGYEVLLARSGDEALVLSFERDPDLILLDVRMQGMTGYEVCAALRAHERTQMTPIVMVTALDSDEEKQRALAAGADDFIIKPFSSLTMLTRVKSLVRISRLQHDLKTMRQSSDRFAEVSEATLESGAQQVTALCVGFKGFAAYAESQSTQDLFAVLNRAMAAMRDLVTHYGGLWEQWRGDTVMAYFGAPLATDEDALNAMKTALAMQQTDEMMPGPGIGLHTGTAFTGKVGRCYAVAGDAVSAAYRLQVASQANEILVSETVFSQVADSVQARPFRTAWPGNDQAAAVAYRVLGLKQSHV